MSEIQLYIDTLAEMRKQTEIAHQAIRDLKTERNELMRLRKEWFSNEDLMEKIQEQTGETIEKFLEDLLVQMKEVEKAIYDRFDSIVMICLGEDPLSIKEGRKSVIELVKDFVYAKKIPLHLTEEIHVMMCSATYAEQNVKIGKRVNRLTGHKLGDLPVLIDDRVKPDYLIVYLPDFDDDGTPGRFLVNLRTNDGMFEALEATAQLEKKRMEKVPAGFRRGPIPERAPKKRKAGPA